MQVTRIGLAILTAGTFLLAGGAYAQFTDEARLDGQFSTKQDGQTADGDNEACFSFDDDDDSEVSGEVRAVSGGCTAVINYDTDSFNSASGKALKPGQTAGTAKLSQSIFSDIDVALEDNETTGCFLAFSSEARPEKCSVKSSLKGTQVPDTEPDDDNDTVETNKVSAKCELGENLSQMDTDPDGETGIQAPTLEQAEAVIAAFVDRDDVKLGTNGKLSIKHDGVPDATTPHCDN